MFLVIEEFRKLEHHTSIYTYFIGEPRTCVKVHRRLSCNAGDDVPRRWVLSTPARLLVIVVNSR